MAKGKTKAIEDATRAWQLVIGCGGRVRPRDEQKLRDRANKAVLRVAKQRNADPVDVEIVIVDEAKSRGGICPIPGKDI